MNITDVSSPITLMASSKILFSLCCQGVTCSDRHRFPLCWRLIRRFRLFPLLVDELCVHQMLSADLPNEQVKPIRVTNGQLRVVPERLLIHIAEEVEWLRTHVGSVNPALQETPEILKPVRMDVSAHVFNGVVDYFMDVFTLRAVVGLQSIANRVLLQAQRCRAQAPATMVCAEYPQP